MYAVVDAAPQNMYVNVLSHSTASMQTLYSVSAGMLIGHVSQSRAFQSVAYY